MVRLWILTILLLVPSLAIAQQEAPRGRADFDWMPPSVTLGGFVLLPKAHYSSDNGPGVGLQVVRPFRTLFSGKTAADSEIKAKGRLNTDGHGAVEGRVTTFFGEGLWSMRTKFVYASLVRRFWGVGPQTPDEDEEAFRAQDLLAYVELYRRFGPHLGVGVRTEWQDYHYIETEDGGLLESVPYPGRDRGDDNAVGAGFVFEWDTRDGRYEPTTGSFVQGFAMFFRKRQGGDHDFDNWHVDLRRYWSPGLDTVVASQVFLFTVDGSAPIWRLAQLGGRQHSRGYRRGRYLDRSLLSGQIELRRAIVWRIDGVAFAGAASVANRLSNSRIDALRPTVGGGVRLRLRKRRDLLVRADLAFGQNSLRAYFALGHAF